MKGLVLGGRRRHAPSSAHAHGGQAARAGRQPAGAHVRHRQPGRRRHPRHRRHHLARNGQRNPGGARRRLAVGRPFTFISQDRPGRPRARGGHRASLSSTASDFVMYLGDNLIGTMIRDSVMQVPSRTELAASVMLKEVQNPSAFGVAEVDASGQVTRLVEKPKEPKSNLALVGIYMFRPSIFEAISQIKPVGARRARDHRRHQQAHRARRARCSSRGSLRGGSTPGKKDDLLIANHTVLDDWLKPDILGEVDAESQIVGRVRLEQGARIERSSVRGPVIIGKGAVISDSRIGPFTAIGDGVTITRSSVEHSVLMAKARIVDVRGSRTRSSAGASSCTRRARQGALSLMVGDDCVIEH